jgi:hypothetical protein
MPIDIIFTVAAVITALGVIIGGIIAVYRLARTISNSIGLDEKGRTISDRLDRVEHQLWPNGGSSLADRVHQTSEMAKETSTEVKFIKQILIANNPTFVYVDETEQPVSVMPRKRVRKKAS